MIYLINNNEYTVSIFFNYKKDFNSTSQSIILHKFDNYGDLRSNIKPVSSIFNTPNLC